jgi:hypothetical protein
MNSPENTDSVCNVPTIDDSFPNEKTTKHHTYNMQAKLS